MPVSPAAPSRGVLLRCILSLALLYASPVARAEAPPAWSSRESASEIRKEPPARVWTWVAIGIGSAALAGAVVTGSLAIIRDNELWSKCPSGRCYSYDYRGDYDRDVERQRALGLSTDILLGAAAAGLASGIALYFLEPRKRNAERKPFSIYSTACRGGGGLSLSGSF